MGGWILSEQLASFIVVKKDFTHIDIHMQTHTYIWIYKVTRESFEIVVGSILKPDQSKKGNRVSFFSVYVVKVSRNIFAFDFTMENSIIEFRHNKTRYFNLVQYIVIK